MEHVILDTDLGGDVDDLGALAVLHTLRAAGHCELLAVMSDTPQTGAIDAIHATNRYFGAGHVPVGRPPWAMRSEDSYADAVARSAGVSIDVRDAPTSTALYRRILADAADASVTIATIGPLLLVDQLLASPADAASKLNGRDLVAAKVNRVVMMGGAHPASGARPETNFRAWDVRRRHRPRARRRSRRPTSRSARSSWARSSTASAPARGLPSCRPIIPSASATPTSSTGRRGGSRAARRRSARGRSGIRSPAYAPPGRPRRGLTSTAASGATSTPTARTAGRRLTTRRTAGSSAGSRLGRSRTT